MTIAGGKRSRGGGHVDGPSEDAKFSDDFDIVYVGSSCSLLVVDRGNQAIREIQLHDDDCSSYEYDGNLHLGKIIVLIRNNHIYITISLIFTTPLSGGAVLVAACFFGYMLALLQRRISSMFSSEIVRPRPLHIITYLPTSSHASFSFVFAGFKKSSWQGHATCTISKSS